MESPSEINKIETFEEYSQYLTFVINNDEYGLEVSNIREVIEYDQSIHLTRIPMAHDCILGVINLRGEVIPVIDLASRIYNKKITITNRTCIVIIELDDGDEKATLGAMIDLIKGVLNIYERDIEEVPDFGANIRSEFISKIGKIGGSFTVFLYPNALLDIDELSELNALDVDMERMLSMKTIGDEELSFEHLKQDKKEDDEEFGEEHDFVILTIGDEVFGIDMVFIQEIIDVTEIKRVPNALEFMKGVISLRENIVPVVDMRTRCDLDEKEYDKSTSILIVKLDQSLVGLIVDSVSDVLKIKINKIQYPPHYSSKIDNDFINGIIDIDEEIIIMLDIDKILSPDEKEMLESADIQSMEIEDIDDEKGDNNM